jgi:hypothetical protein
VRRQRRKCPVEGADRRAGRSDDDDIVFHVITPFAIRLNGGGSPNGSLSLPGKPASGAGDPAAHGRILWNVGTGLSIGRIAGLFCINLAQGEAAGASPPPRRGR